MDFPSWCEDLGDAENEPIRLCIAQGETSTLQTLHSAVKVQSEQ